MGHDGVLVRRPARRAKQGGQAIIMVTLALVAMCGLLGLAVDLGWAYFVKRSAQAAADTAAMAAVNERLAIAGGWNAANYRCLGGSCDTNYACTSGITAANGDGENLDSACEYAKRNGFVDGGRQRVRIIEGDDSSGAPPTRPGRTYFYWATVRVTETVPQLFSAIMGHPEATVSARATAAIYQSQLKGSIIVLNRDQDDPGWNNGDQGVNLDVGSTASSSGTVGNCDLSTDSICAGGGIILSSGCDGSGSGTGCNSGSTAAGLLRGNAEVKAPFTDIRSQGWWEIVSGQGNVAGAPGRWENTPSNGGAGSQFDDPTKQKPQPPVYTASGALANNCEVPGGVLAPANGGTLVVGPGQYYATATDRNGQVYATGAPIRVSGNVIFASGGSCYSPSQSPTGFGAYVVYGGIQVNNAANITFEPGQMIFAGVQAGNGNSSPGALFDITAGQVVLQGSGNSGAGNLFVFTDPNYPGLAAMTPTRIQGAVMPTLKQGISGFKTGTGGNGGGNGGGGNGGGNGVGGNGGANGGGSGSTGVSISLDGLRGAAGSGLPSQFSSYSQFLMWQDRRNSGVAYNPNDGGYACAAPYLNCPNTDFAGVDGGVPGSQEMFVSAGANVQLRGAIYQPRGAFATVSAGSGMQSALQIITGALRTSGSGSIILDPVSSGITKVVVGLIE